MFNRVKRTEGGQAAGGFREWAEELVGGRRRCHDGAQPGRMAGLQPAMRQGGQTDRYLEALTSWSSEGSPLCTWFNSNR